MNILTPEIKNVVSSLIEVYKGDNRLVDKVLTDVVEGGYADECWGNEVYEGDDWKEGGIELDQKYMEELEKYIESCVR